LGRRRRRVLRIIRRTLPKVFSCPRCGVISVKVSMKTGSAALVACGSCGLKQEYTVTRKKEPIDIYNEFVDGFMSGRF
jgi:transcription elongation factor Elf1